MRTCPTCNRAVEEQSLFCPYDGQAIVADADDPLIGSTLDAKYRLEEKVGEGGMGKVYRATHVLINVTVAVKILNPNMSSDPTTLGRFRQEAHAAALIRHPNVIAVTDFGVTRDTGMAYLVMEFLEGAALREKLRQQRLDYGEIFLIARQICQALHAAHAKGIVHRDLKPDNIWLIKSEDGFDQVKVLDFGIAKLKASPETVRLTKRGMIVGTPYYMSPEQCFGEDLDARSDIYSLGVILYEMLAGQLPFQSENTMDVVLKHTSEAPRPPRELRPDIPALFEEVVLRALSKEAKDRQQSALELAKELDAFLYSEGSETLQLGTIAGRPLRERGREAGARPGKTTRPQPTPLTNADGRTTSPKSAPPSEPAEAEITTKTYGALEATPQRPAASPVIEGRKRHSARRAGALITALLLGVALLVFALLPGKQGFTLVVRDAPPDSEVYVGGARRGAVAADGEFRLSGLAAGEPQEVRVTRDGYKEFRQSLTGEEGKEQVLSAPMSLENLPGEIEYKGAMALIPAGDFTMGDDHHLEDEKPARVISATELPDYYIDKHEVTNAQYREFCDATGRPYPTPTPTASQWFSTQPDWPVVGVSWNDAVAYAKWAGKRLPSEAEWEKAASWDPVAQRKRQWPWGDVPDAGRANLLSRQPTPVGSYGDGASAYGVYDLAGNAEEWVDAFYQPYPDNQAPDAKYGVTYRVVRGGGFQSRIDLARTTYRNYNKPDIRPYMKNETEEVMTAIGFRCAISAHDPRLRDRLLASPARR